MVAKCPLCQLAWLTFDLSMYFLHFPCWMAVNELKMLFNTAGVSFTCWDETKTCLLYLTFEISERWKVFFIAPFSYLYTRFNQKIKTWVNISASYMNVCHLFWNSIFVWCWEGDLFRFFTFLRWTFLYCGLSSWHPPITDTSFQVCSLSPLSEQGVISQLFHCRKHSQSHLMTKI